MNVTRHTISTNNKSVYRNWWVAERGVTTVENFLSGPTTHCLNRLLLCITDVQYSLRSSDLLTVSCRSVNTICSNVGRGLDGIMDSVQWRLDTEVWQPRIRRWWSLIQRVDGRSIDNCMGVGETMTDWQADWCCNWLVASLHDEICRLRVWRLAANLSHDCRRIFEQASR